MFNGVSDIVLDKTKDYLIGVAISMVFLAVYMSVLLPVYQMMEGF